MLIWKSLNIIFWLSVESLLPKDSIASACSTKLSPVLKGTFLAGWPDWNTPSCYEFFCAFFFNPLSSPRLCQWQQMFLVQLEILLFDYWWCFQLTQLFSPEHSKDNLRAKQQEWLNWHHQLMWTKLFACSFSQIWWLTAAYDRYISVDTAIFATILWRTLISEKVTAYFTEFSGWL